MSVIDVVRVFATDEAVVFTFEVSSAFGTLAAGRLVSLTVGLSGISW